VGGLFHGFSGGVDPLRLCSCWTRWPPGLDSLEKPKRPWNFTPQSDRDARNLMHDPSRFLIRGLDLDNIYPVFEWMLDNL
jgi:hypothetical protein